LSVAMVLAARGDAGWFSLPLVTVMFSLSSFAKLPYEPSPRPNAVIFYLKRIPTAIVFTILGFVPPFAVAIPGLLLAQDPVLYTAWCGVGFPVLSFVMRLMAMTYFTNHAYKQVQDGRMTPDGVVPFISTASFMIAITLLFGNVMLLFMSESAEFAALSSALAIATEVFGKLYTVTIIVHKSKLQRKLKEKVSRVVNRANSGDNNEVNTEAEAEAEAKAKADAEEEKKLEEQMVMYSIRLSNEIIAEKVCIIVSAAVNAFFIDSTSHSVETIVVYTLIFFFTELAADALLVYLLVEYYDVPILWLPKDKWEWSKSEFWAGVFQVALMPVIGASFFLYAYMLSNEYIKEEEDGVNLDALANSTLTNATNATLG
jgi:hypothetical protein